MSVKFICDGCGQEAAACVNQLGDPFKPHNWFSRSDKDGRQDACCRECIDRVATKSGKTGVVLPI